MWRRAPVERLGLLFFINSWESREVGKTESQESPKVSKVGKSASWKMPGGLTCFLTFGLPDFPDFRTILTFLTLLTFRLPDLLIAATK